MRSLQTGSRGVRKLRNSPEVSSKGSMTGYPGRYTVVHCFFYILLHHELTTVAVRSLEHVKYEIKSWTPMGQITEW